MRGNGRTKGSAEENDVVFGEAPLLGQVAPSGLGVEIGALFRDLSLAATIAPVVEDENGKAQIVKDFEGI